MIGDFNCYIGKSGGPWSLDAVNERGCDLPKMIERQCLISVNSQDLCSGCTGTYFAEGGSVQTTTVHILMRKDSVHFVKSCFVSDAHSHNLSYHLPIICCRDISVGTKKTSMDSYRRSSVNWKSVNNIAVLKVYQEKSGKTCRISIRLISAILTN